MSDTAPLRSIREALARLPHVRRHADRPLRAERLAGMTNRTYRLQLDGRMLFLRIPGNGAGALVDRESERHNLAQAIACGIAPEILDFDVEHGLLLAPYRERALTLTPALLQARPALCRDVAHTLRRLHESDIAFRGRLDPFASLRRYEARLRALGGRLPPLAAELEGALLPLEAALAKLAPPLRPCHNDPVCENFLLEDGRIWLVDFEYSGMNDPLWDVADLIVEADLGQDLQEKLLEAYFGRTPDPCERARLTAYMLLCDLLWGVWAFLELAAEAVCAVDLRSYGLRRLARAAERLRAPATARVLAPLLQSGELRAR